MKFNIAWCWILHLGWNNAGHKYRLGKTAGLVGLQPSQSPTLQAGEKEALLGHHILNLYFIYKGKLQDFAPVMTAIL